MRINDKTLPGVKMGKGFRDALFSPMVMKDYISNESRLEHGIRVLDIPPKFASRSLTLEFQITGRNKAEFETNKQRLFSTLYEGDVKLEVPEITADVFHLIYTGKSTSYSSGLGGCSCKVKVGFDEPNPSNRS